jgi:hypothetical protein
MQSVIRYFIYGFLLFAIIWLLIDMPFYYVEKEKDFDYRTFFISGILGGVSFIVSYGSGLLLKVFILGRHK